MERYLTYDEILKKCEEINRQHELTNTPFIEAVDVLCDESEEENPKTFLVDVYRELMSVIDQEIKKLENKVNIDATCFKGCSNCCYFPIIVTKLEAKLIMYYIETHGSSYRNKVIEHLGRYFKKNDEKINEMCGKLEEGDGAKLNYISKQLPCPLLDTENNTCLAYEVRPTPCRTYLNYADPGVCKEEFMPKEPFSFHFLHDFYIEEMNLLLQDFLYDEIDLDGINYPDDLVEYNYLPILLREELKLKA